MLINVKNYIVQRIALLRCKFRSSMLHRAVIAGHVAYGGTAFYEGHGLYPVFALVLAVFIVIEYLAE